jgi:hypothetical protein
MSCGKGVLADGRGHEKPDEVVVPESRNSSRLYVCTVLYSVYGSGFQITVYTVHSTKSRLFLLLPTSGYGIIPIRFDSIPHSAALCSAVYFLFLLRTVVIRSDEMRHKTGE